MLAASSGLAAHLAGRATTLAWLWRIQRTDAQVFGFTSHDADIVLDGVTYVAAYGIDPSALQAGVGLAVGNAEVQTVFYASGMTEDDLRAGVWDHADVRVRLVNWQDTGHGVLKMLRGWLGEVQHDGFRYTAELRGLADLLNRPSGEIVSPSCPHTFCDAACTLDPASYTSTGEVLSVTSAREFDTDLTGAAVDAYAGGMLTWTGGANAGRAMEVKNNDAAGNFTLHLPMVGPVQAGDTFSVILGCPKTSAFCSAQGNLVNFGGFPDVPGTDRALRVGGQ